MPSIREQIVEKVKERLEGMTSPTYSVVFDEVQRSPIKSVRAGKKYVAAIFDDTDNRTPDTDPVVRVTLNLAIEVAVYIEKNTVPSTVLNEVINDVEVALMTDRTFGGLAIDTFINRTEHDIEGRFDKYSETTMFISVSYRHNNKNPSQIV